MEHNPKAPLGPQRNPHGKRAELAAWIERQRPAEIGETELAALQTALAPVSSGYLRRLLRESPVKLAPMVEGVRQGSFESLERSLLALLDEYDRGDVFRRARVRNLVIEAKDHAKFAANRSQSGGDPEKEEMILWMLTWLENPPLFREWVQLRKRAGVP
jgi:hypothetical protein